MTAEDNRRNMPTVAAFVDEVRKYWPGAKVIYATENGITLGKKPETTGVVVSEGWYTDDRSNRSGGSGKNTRKRR